MEVAAALALGGNATVHPRPHGGDEEVRQGTTNAMKASAAWIASRNGGTARPKALRLRPPSSVHEPDDFVVIKIEEDNGVVRNGEERPRGG